MHKSFFECSLFSGVEPEQIKELTEHIDYHTQSYACGEVIALQNTRLGSLMILCSGSITAEREDSSGNTIKVETISSVALIAPTYLFTENNLLPVNLTAKTETYIITIEREDLCTMMSINRGVMLNFMAILSAPNTFISEKTVYLTYKTIKGKFANYLLKSMEQEKSTSLRNPLSQREMAEMFAVTRPALARAIGELAREGAIYVQGKNITILYPEKLKQYTRN